MSVLRVYLNWVNSVLSDTGRQVEGIADIQKGEVLCQLLDVLCPGENLHLSVTAVGKGADIQYLDRVLACLQTHKVKLRLNSQDICQGDVKSVLDLLWAIILNFTIHNPRRSIEKRTIRNGKRLTLRWCQSQLSEGVWDLQKSVTHNLCSCNNFCYLLQKFCGLPLHESSQNKEEELQELLVKIESKYKIKGDIIRPKEVLAGTIEDHDLLIYLSLLRWRAGDSVESNSSSEEFSNTDTTRALLKSSSTTQENCQSASLPKTGNRKDQSKVPLSHMLNSYMGEDGTTKMSERKNVTFSSGSANPSITEESFSKRSSRFSRPSSAPTSRLSPTENKTSGRFLRSFSPSRYAKSFEIPPEKKEEIENRTSKINGHVPKAVTSSAIGQSSNTNRFSEDSYDWHSSDMESTVDRSVLQDTINLNAKEVVTRCENSQKTDKKQSITDSKNNFGNGNVDANSHIFTGSNVPALGDLSNVTSKNNFKIPAGGVPMFGMNPGVPMMSSIGGGVPLFLLPGHSPEMAQLLNVLQQQQHARQAIADTADGTVSLDDASRFETSEQISEADYTEYSNITGEISSLSESRGKFEKSFSHDSSEAELKQIEHDLPNNSHSVLEERQPETNRLTDSGCESQSRPDSNQELKIPEDESLRKIRVLRESLQKPVEDERSLDKNKSIGSDDLHIDDLNFGKQRAKSSSRSLPPRPQSAQHFSKRLLDSMETRKYSSDYDKIETRVESPPGDQQEMDIVRRLSSEIQNLKSKVRTLERSQEKVGHEKKLSDEDHQRSGKRYLPKSPPGGQDPESLPRSLLRSPEPCSLSRTESNRRARDTVNDLLITMQSPVSREKTDQRDLDTRARRDLSKRPLLSFHGFGRSLSEDRLSSNRSRRETHFDNSDWKSRSFHGDSENGREYGGYPRGHSRSLQDLSGTKLPTGILTDDELIVKPPSAVPIMYGYSSPIQKVSSDIWGVDMKDLDNLEPGRQEKWRQLTEPKKFMTDSEIIELKQCLASATMENEILHAKVGNANHEIGEKMTKMAQVLEETKLSLIKMQAENEELQTLLNREKQRSDTLEVRVADLEGLLKKAKGERDQLESELNESRILLAGTNADGIHVVEQENYKLKRQLQLSKDELKKSKEELENIKVSRNRAHSAVKELQVKLDDTREENEMLNREISEVKVQERSYRTTATLLSRAAAIEQKYSDRENKSYLSNPQHEGDKTDKLYSPVTPAPKYTTSTPYSKLKSSEPLMTSSPSRGRYIPRAVSPTEISPVKNYPSLPKSYNYEEISPAVKSSYREIYPHRRPHSVGHTDLSRDNLSSVNDRHRKWSLTGHLNYSDSDLGDNQAEKPYIETYIDSRPPHQGLSRDVTPSRSRALRSPVEDRKKTYTEEIERLKAHLSRSYQNDDGLSRSTGHLDNNSSSLMSSSQLDHSYLGRSSSGYRQKSDIKGRELTDITPQRSIRTASRSPTRAPVRGILKPASSDQDLRRIGRNSPPSRRSASPNVTFNTEVASRSISPQSTVSRRETLSRLQGDSIRGGIPLFGVPSRRYGIVRNLNDEFDDEEPVRDCGVQPVVSHGFGAKNWFENKNSSEVPTLTSDQRHYADMLIDKYVSRRLPVINSSFHSP